MTAQFDPPLNVNDDELTDEELATSKPMREALPELHIEICNSIARRGRPKIDSPKRSISIRLDPEVIDALKADGKGWQTRANALLRQSLGL